MNADELNNRGANLSAMGRFPEALAAYDQAIQLSSTDRTVPVEKIWRNKAHLYDEIGGAREALECCDHAIEINPRYAEGWSLKASVLVSLNQYSDAVDCCDKAIELDPKLGSAWMNKGAAQLSAGYINSAMASFKEADRLGIPRAIKGIESCQEALDEWEG